MQFNQWRVVTQINGKVKPHGNQMFATSELARDFIYWEERRSRCHGHPGPKLHLAYQGVQDGYDINLKKVKG